MSQPTPHELPTMSVVAGAAIAAIGNDAHLLLKINGSTTLNGRTYPTVVVATAADAAHTAARFLLLNSCANGEIIKVACVQRNMIHWMNATGVIAPNGNVFTAAGGQVASAGANQIGINIGEATVANGRFPVLVN